jgi:hypothetical protein
MERVPVKEYTKYCAKCIFQLATSDKECQTCPEKNALEQSEKGTFNAYALKARSSTIKAN